MLSLESPVAAIYVRYSAVDERMMDVSSLFSFMVHASYSDDFLHCQKQGKVHAIMIAWMQTREKPFKAS